MKHLIQQYDWKPKYYDPFADKKEFAKQIEVHHVSRLYGVMMARIFAGNSAIDIMFSESECFDVVGAHKVMEFLLPRFDDGNGGYETLWEWQAAQMRYYMKHIIQQYGWAPK